jgi:hypothetical protein
MPEHKQLVDPLTNYVYSTTGDGLVEVRDPATGAQGIFDDTGAWHSGDISYANRQLLGWIGRLSARLATQRGGDS